MVTQAKLFHHPTLVGGYKWWGGGVGESGGIFLEVRNQYKYQPPPALGTTQPRD